MHGFCEKENALGNNTLRCGLDRAQWFTGVPLKNELRSVLLEAQCNPTKSKEFYHPISFNEMETKLWLKTWHMWYTVESTAVSLVHAIAKDILPTIPMQCLTEGETRYVH